MNRVLRALPLVVASLALLAAAALGIMMASNGSASGQPIGGAVSYESTGGQPMVHLVTPQNRVCKSLANRQQDLAKDRPDEAANELPIGCTL
jgi:hypothetical protein